MRVFTVLILFILVSPGFVLAEQPVDPFALDRQRQERLAYEQQERQRNDPSRLFDQEHRREPPPQTPSYPAETVSPTFNRDHSNQNPSWCATQGYSSECR